MPKIIFIEPDGAQHEVVAEAGATLMEIARANGMPGITADCSGACACATCHVHVTPEWWDVTGGPHSEEREILEFADDVGDRSRLSCQIVLSPEMDGLVIALPAAE